MAYNKYHNKKIIYDGLKFDSQHEADRYCELKLMERGKVITGLDRQVKFELIPSQKIDGKVVERPCTYIADFTYTDKDGRFVVEDAKGMRIEPYITKRKLMLFLKGIRVIEV